MKCTIKLPTYNKYIHIYLYDRIVYINDCHQGLCVAPSPSGSPPVIFLLMLLILLNITAVG